MKIKKPSFSSLLTPILIICILLFAGLLAMVSYNAFHRERTFIEKYTHSQMKTLVLDLESKLMSTEAALLAQSHEEHLTLADSTFIYEMLEDIITDQKFIRHALVNVWDENNSDTTSHHFHVSQRPDGKFEHQYELTTENHVSKEAFYCFYEAFYSEKPEWSHPYMDTIFTQDWVTTCFVAADNRKAMVGIDVEISTLLETINNLQFYENSKMYIKVPDGETFSLENGKLEIINKIEADKKDFIKIPAHYKRLDIDIINVVPKESIYSSIWTNIFIALMAFIIALTLLAILVHRSFVKAQEKLAQSIKKSQEEEMVLKHHEDEIAIASRIQNMMLTAPGRGAHYAIEDGKHIDIITQIIPAREVGGDFYEYRIKGNNLVVCIGDVSDKGIPAALIMATFSTLFHSYVSKNENPDPADMLRHMNIQLYRRNEEMMFVTLWVGILDLNTGKLRYSSAGHNPPVLMHNESVGFMKMCQGLPLGMFEDSVFPMEEHQLCPNDTLLLYTDGITEAENDNHVLFGDEKLLQACQTASSHCPGILCHSVLQSVSNHAHGCQQSDDITLLSFSYGGHFAQLHSISDVKKLHTLVEECSSSDEAALVLEEATVNAFKHGKAKIVCAEYKNGNFILSSDGDDFDPTKYVVPEVKDELSIGGRGIPLMRMLCSNITYHRTDDGLSILNFELKK